MVILSIFFLKKTFQKHLIEIYVFIGAHEN